MKKQTLLILMFLFTLGANSQNCNFYYNFNTGALNIVNFYPNQIFSSSIYHFDWDFGDGTTSTVATPTHAYNALPPYYVCYTVYDTSNNIVCTACDSVVSSHVPVNCTFTATQTSSLTILCQTSSSSAYQVLWSFDNSATFVLANPVTNSYNQAGTYNVCMMEIEIATGDTVCFVCDSVAVTTSSFGCSFTATANPASTYSIDFIANNAPFGSIVTWDFGDNTTDTGIQVTHLYNAIGIFNVCMTVVDPNGGSCTYCNPVSVGSTHGNCLFTYTVDTINPYNFIFAGQPFNPSDSVSWTFGDGTGGSGLQISHTYSTNGIFTVCMNELDSLGNIICTSCISIAVGANNACNFTSASNPLNPLTIDFQANGGFFSTVTWDFGDGSSGTGLSVSHTYAAPGTYQVCITVTTNGAVTCTGCNWVTVSGGGPSNCQASFVSTSLALTAYFIDLSVVNSTSVTYSWDFGDGGTSNIRFPQHTYALPGTYTACLTIVSGTCTDIFCNAVIVDTSVISPVLCSAFFAIVQLAPYQVSVVNLSSGMNLSFLWDFGDGTTDTQPYPSHFYSNIGSYNLCLTVSDANGCTSTYCDTLSVDSLGNVYRMLQGFTVNVYAPSQLNGVKEVKKNTTFRTYPNPVTSELHISIASGNNSAVTYRILSLQGSEVLFGKLNGFEGQINVKSLTAGTYLLEVSLADGSRSYQTIIKN